MGTAAAHIWNDVKFKYGDIRELNFIVLNLACRFRRAEVPLLTDNFSE